MEMIKEGTGATLLLIAPILFTRSGSGRHYPKQRDEKCDYFFFFGDKNFTVFLHLHKKKNQMHV